MNTAESDQQEADGVYHLTHSNFTAPPTREEEDALRIIAVGF